MFFYSIGEVLLNHFRNKLLMSFICLCVFCPSVHWLQRILDVYVETHGMELFSTAAKLFV